MSDSFILPPSNKRSRKRRSIPSKAKLPEFSKTNIMEMYVSMEHTKLAARYLYNLIVKGVDNHDVCSSEK